MQERVTVIDLARRAGVSKSTVSLVLQGSELVQATTRARVQDAIRELGYVYNRGAANLRQHRSKTKIVGIVRWIPHTNLLSTRLLKFCNLMISFPRCEIHIKKHLKIMLVQFIYITIGGDLILVPLFIPCSWVCTKVSTTNTITITSNFRT